MSLYENTVPTFLRILHNMEQFFDKAQAHAAAKKYEVDTLLNARLAPDMFALARQVQIACDTAKFTAARLTGKEAPKHEDNETTVAQLRDRIGKTRAYLETFSAKDFQGAEERKVTMPWAPNKWMTGADYAEQMAMPNFYFHAAATYMILRHNGVDLGKMDFLGNVNMRDA